MPVMPDEEERLLLLNLGRMREGEALRQYLSKTLLRVPSFTADSRALHVEHGSRLLASDILKAIEVKEDEGASRDSIVRAVHRPWSPVAYDARPRRRVPGVSPDDAEADRERGERPNRRRKPRADRRLGGFLSSTEG